MAGLVIDASIALAWVLPDEAGGDDALARTAAEGAVVPALFRLEVANSLTVALRRRRIPAALRDDALRDLAALPIVVDPDTDAQAWRGTLALADRHALTLYDAAYLELALRRGLPLATLDTDLLREAATAGVRLT